MDIIKQPMCYFLETRVIILVAKLPFRHCLGKRRSDPRPFVKSSNGEIAKRASTSILFGQFSK